MHKNIIFIMIFSVMVASAFAQQIPVGSCGIVNIYDAAGNRTKRTYFCNNGTDPYPQRPAGQNTTLATTDSSAGTELEFQEVDALYPNPTTGKFSVTFSKALDNAVIHILDANGKIITRIKANGNKVDFDLSARAAGVYYVRIEENGKSITKKVVKQ